MSKKQKVQEFIRSELNTPMLNYQVYVMNIQEKIITFLLASAIGGVIGLTFYGGLFKNSDGFATSATLISNIVVLTISVIIGNIIIFPIRRDQLLNKRKTELITQFQSFLEAITVALSSGMNITDSLINSYTVLSSEYSEKSYIAKEVKEMITGTQNNVSLESIMHSLSERSQIDDIRNFAIVFEICFRAGGDMKEIVRNTNAIITEKVEIASEIETAIASNKTQFTAMMGIPIIMILLLRVMSSSFCSKLWHCCRNNCDYSCNGDIFVRL